MIVASLRLVHRSRWGNLYLCGLWHWRYILKLQCLLSSACWLLFILHYDSKTFFSLSLRLVPATDNFIMLVMIFSPVGLVWTSRLNFRFRLLLRWKETDNRMNVLKEVFARQKTWREQTDTFLLQQITHVTWNPCCYHGKLCILFHLSAWKVRLSWLVCGCHLFCSLFFTLA